jgi:hypothetical protein
LFPCQIRRKTRVTVIAPKICHLKAGEGLTRIPKSKSNTAQPHRKRTPLACGFRRLAENPVPQTFSRQNRTKNVRQRFGRAAPTGTRAACATIPISEFGFKQG